MVGQLRSVMVARDSKRWKEITHTIKGAARGVGAFSFGDAAASAEPVDPANAERAGQCIDRLSEEAMAVHDFIRHYLAA
jgi:HPt (histidine-containing phosphotransfer) domain-containing protein